MTRHYRRSKKAPGRWEDASTVQLLAEQWSMRELKVGDTWDPGDGIVRTVQDIRTDPRTGGTVIVGTATAPAKVAP